MATPHQTLDLPKDLGNGLMMRLATDADTDSVGRFQQAIT